MEVSVALLGYLDRCTSVAIVLGDDDVWHSKSRTRNKHATTCGGSIKLGPRVCGRVCVLQRDVNGMYRVGDELLFANVYVYSADAN